MHSLKGFCLQTAPETYDIDPLTDILHRHLTSILPYYLHAALSMHIYHYVLSCQLSIYTVIGRANKLSIVYCHV